MGRTVESLQDEMDSAEFAAWMAYYESEPFGYEMENFRTGLVCSTQANLYVKKGRRRLKPSDFYPETKKPIVMTPRQERELRARKARRSKK